MYLDYRGKLSQSLTILILTPVLIFVAGQARGDDTDPPVSSICIESNSGLVVSESNADIPRPPASMVKMMMLLLIAEGVSDGTWSLDKSITASRHAEGMGGTQVYLKAGETHPLGELARAIAVASANDAAMAVAEGLWGSEEAYLKRMNERAQELGMQDSEFHSVHGLPPEKGEAFDRTTARDMAILGQWCVRQPLVMQWTGTKELTFREGDAVKYNTNKMLWRMDDCDGLKTGYIRAAGFCVTATAQRDDVRLITVVMGHDNKYGRFSLAEELLDTGFAEVQRVQCLAKGQAVEEGIPVYNASQSTTPLVAAEDVWVVVRKEDRYDLTVEVDAPEHIHVPVGTDEELGQAVVKLGEQVLARVPLVTPGKLQPAGWGTRLERAGARSG